MSNKSGLDLSHNIYIYSRVFDRGFPNALNRLRIEIDERSSFTPVTSGIGKFRIKKDVLHVTGSANKN